MTAVGVAASIAGLGTYATFTSTTSATQTVTAGTVVIALGTAGTATNRLTIAATGIVPGDTIQRAVDLTNSGNQNLASITLTTVTQTASTLLDSDTTNGLQMTIDKCSLAGGWTESAFPYTYTCPAGTITHPLVSRPIIGSTIALTGTTLSALTAAGVDHLLVTLTLPAIAPNTLQGLSSTIQYTFTATQRAATNQ